ncbi:MAG: polysaccharide deacetylase family protein [Bacilli bacterium]|nr:polysaccharide deacetylase family protein [Bacilli bacterium]
MNGLYLGIYVVLILLLVILGAFIFMNRKAHIKKIIFFSILIFTILLFVGYYGYSILNKPILKINGSEIVNISVFDKYNDEGFEIKHPNSTKLKKAVKVDNNVDTNKVGTYNVKYSLKYFGKDIYATRIVNVIDEIKPTIELKGNTELTLSRGIEYVEQGYIATDNYDGDITNKVKVENNILDEVGKYEIIYSVTDSSGNSYSIKRIVNRLNNNNGVIYLTFDDGPSSNTSKILDILKSENIKATFFVVNYGSAYDLLVQRIVNEGHTIALHSYTHDYKIIYASEESYFNDLITLKNKVKNTTGIDSTIIRFPGGSSNTISSFNKGIMSRLVNAVKEQGYHYFDWNVDSRDAGVAKNSTEVYNNVMKGLIPNRSNVVLMHDLGYNVKTVEALKSIIEDAKNKGYSFARITNDTPMITHKVNN